LYNRTVEDIAPRHTGQRELVATSVSIHCWQKVACPQDTKATFVCRTISWIGSDIFLSYLRQDRSSRCRTYVFRPCRFLLAFSVLAFSVSPTGDMLNALVNTNSILPSLQNPIHCICTKFCSALGPKYLLGLYIFITKLHKIFMLFGVNYLVLM